MQADSGRTLRSLRVDGGATANDLLMQIQADLLDTEVVRPPAVEVTALGAARLAGRAISFFSPDGDRAGAGDGATSSVTRFLPTADHTHPERLRDLRARWHDAVGKA